MLKDSSVLSSENISNGDFLHVSISDKSGLQSSDNFVNPPVESVDGLQSAGLFLLVVLFLFLFLFILAHNSCFACVFGVTPSKYH